MNSALRERHAKDFEIVKRFVDHRVIELAHAQYVFDGEHDEKDLDLGSVEVRFGNESVLLLKLVGDGESVEAVEGFLKIPEPFEAEDGRRSEWRRVELTDKPEYEFAKGGLLVGIEAVIERWKSDGEERLVGWLLRFDSGQSLTYWNAGDQGWLWVNRLPPAYEHSDLRTEVVESLQEDDDQTALR